MYELHARWSENEAKAVERAFYFRVLVSFRKLNTFVAPPFFGIWAFVAYRLGLSSWLWGFPAVMFVLALVLPVLMYFARLSAAAKIARRAPVQDIRLDENAVSVSSDDGGLTLPWRRFRTVWDVGSYLLLVVSPYLAVKLPKASLPAGAEELVRKNVPPAA
jgi:hypothetical protein